jgi:hypothetical protein
VQVLNIIGAKVLSGEFSASGNMQAFETDKELYPGIYMVRISQKNDPSFSEVLKVIRQ